MYILFPPAFAFLNRLLFRLLYPPEIANVGEVTTWMVFAAALAWSAMILLHRPELRVFQMGWAALALIGAFALAGSAAADPDERLWHWTMAGFVFLGVGGIQLYQSILKRKRPE
jgi:hypothetical protein